MTNSCPELAILHHAMGRTTNGDWVTPDHLPNTYERTKNPAAPHRCAHCGNHLTKEDQ